MLPVTSAEGKLSLSQMRRLKSFLHEGNHEGRVPSRASFDAVPQAAGAPARPGPAGPQVCKRQSRRTFLVNIFQEYIGSLRLIC